MDDFWFSGWGLATFMIIATLVIVGLAVGLAFVIGPPNCDGLTENIGYNHEWTFWGSCRIEIEPGQWIPLSSYIYNSGN